MYFWAFLWLYWRDSLRDDRKLDKRVIFDFDCRFKLDPLTFWGIKDTHLIFFLHPGAQNVQPNAVKYPRCYKTVVVCGAEAGMWRLWVRRWMKSNLAFFFLRRKCRCLFHKSFINYNKKQLMLVHLTCNLPPPPLPHSLLVKRLDYLQSGLGTLPPPLCECVCTSSNN